MYTINIAAVVKKSWMLLLKNRFAPPKNSGTQFAFTSGMSGIRLFCACAFCICAFFSARAEESAPPRGFLPLRAAPEKLSSAGTMRFLPLPPRTQTAAARPVVVRSVPTAPAAPSALPAASVAMTQEEARQVLSIFQPLH